MRSRTLGIAAWMILAIFGCSESPSPPDTLVPNTDDPRTLLEGEACGDPMVVPLRFANDTDIGSLTVYNDETVLTVEFDVDPPYLMSTTLAQFFDPPGSDVAAKREPVTVRAAHDQSGLTERHVPPVAHYAYSINLEEAGWAAGDTLCFNAQTTVLKPGGVSARLQPRVAYAGNPGVRANARQWPLRYVIQPCEGGEGGEE